VKIKTQPSRATTTTTTAAPAGVMSAAKTTQTVTLFTDRPLFAQEWMQALAAAGLEPRAAQPHSLPQSVDRGSALVIDAGSAPYDEDELLAHVGLARAVGAHPIVSVPADVDVSSIDDILDELCGGLVARRPEDMGRVVAAIARRADAGRASRFEYLTVSPRGGELLAIFSDGNAVLVDRDSLEDDDGSHVEAIALQDDATRAVLKLESGRELQLTTSTVARKSLLGSHHRSNGRTNGQIDGVKLGQRIRELRLAAGLTQAELARRTGIHRPNIARVEAGRHTPSLETIARLASAIGVSTTRVLEG
jgi:DNA-binding XRE family transcriptional regulator